MSAPSVGWAEYRRQRRAAGLDKPVRYQGRVTTARATGSVPDPEDHAHPEACVRSQP